MRRFFFCVLALFLLSTALSSFSQQREITQYSVIGAYSYLATPSLNLVQRGFNGDIATNVRPWLSMGFDFSCFTGGSTLLPGYLNTATQAKLFSLPPSVLAAVAGGVAYGSTTYTYQAGPQINYRRFRKVTLFVRPALGLLHAKIQTNPTNATAAAVISNLLGGKLSASDNTLFYGIGGGGTWEVTPHFGLRATVDFARYDFFPNMLNGARNSVRLSVGTKFGFGRNIVTKY